MKLTDHVALVTGGGSGIGLAIARALIQCGNKVVICGRTVSTLQDAQIVTPELHAIPCDITDMVDVEAMLGEIARHHGRLTMLVNNAGVQHNYLLPSTEDGHEQIHQEIDVNFRAVVCLTHRCLPLLMSQPEALVVNVGSGTGLMPKLDGIVYSATKAAVHSFTIGLRWQLETTSVRVFELFPPVVTTPMTIERTEPMISPEVVAEALIRGIIHNQPEIYVGKVRALSLMVRFVPFLATRIMKKG